MPVAAQDFGRDYIVPTALHEARMRANEAAAPDAELPDGTLVPYTSFDGTHYELYRYAGKNVVFFFPSAWLPPAGLTDDERRILIDRSDHLYEMNLELIGIEPAGGLERTPIAFVKTCGGACGYVGWKGIEVDPGDGIRNEIRSTGDTIWGGIAHEMNHNFDVFAAHLAYADDAAHGWTQMMDGVGRAFFRTGDAHWPEDRLELWTVRGTGYREYLGNPDASWRACVDRDSVRCPYRLSILWGATGVRTFQVHGLARVPAFFSFLRDWTSTHAPGTTPEGKEDLRIAALSAATGADIACYVDTWKWWASSSVRNEMRSHGVNPVCLDVDGDKSRPFEGDPDDHDATRHHAATELPNGIDDDGNGVIDDVRHIEPLPGDFPSRLALGSAAVVDGALVEKDGDSFVVSFPVASRVRLNLASKGAFQGWLFIYRKDGSWLHTGFTFSGTEGITDIELPAGETRIGVELNVQSAPGEYRLSIHTIPRWPYKWGETTVAPSGADRFRLTAKTTDASVFAEAPTELRFWVSGQGWVSRVPWAETVSVDWAAPPSPDGAVYLIRAQPFRDGRPVADVTSAFRLEPGARRRPVRR